MATNRDDNKKAGRLECSPRLCRSDWAPGVYTALKALLSARLCSAVWCIISDCDETYNYWEPTHFLLYGSGFQTWEYSPQFALRSYFYLLLHATPAWLYDAAVSGNRVLVFFFMRCMLALLCSACELCFYRGCVAVYGGAVGRVALCLMVFSAGNFAAATAYLPSSFAMYGVACGCGAWLLQRPRLAVLCIAVAALIGWPFAALAGVPIALDLAFRRRRLPLLICWSAIGAALLLVPMVTVDSSYYDRLVLAPLNLLCYNVFSSHGPNLYGTEPWHFYFVNGFLNFNFAFPLALFALPVHEVCRRLVPSSPPSVPVWLSLSPLYLWLFVFVLQPHKEERFLFPVYPLVCLAAAITIESCRSLMCRVPWRSASYWAARLTIALLVAISCLGLSRTLAQYRGYHAPVSVFLEVQRLPPAPRSAVTRLCLAKEWHRFPSSFFLPDNRWEVRFVQSAFTGQLPQPFLSGEDATSVVRENFNGANKEEKDRYVPASSCHYLVDLDTPDGRGLEPRYSQLTDTWRTLHTVPFLDAKRSHRLLRAFYVPFVTELYSSYNNYTLLENTARSK